MTLSRSAHYNAVDGPTTREEYRERAERAEWQAQQTHDVEAKRLSEETARYWRLMAELTPPFRR